jgi:hypothetical protein
MKGTIRNPDTFNVALLFEHCLVVASYSCLDLARKSEQMANPSCKAVVKWPLADGDSTQCLPQVVKCPYHAWDRHVDSSSNNFLLPVTAEA